MNTFSKTSKIVIISLFIILISLLSYALYVNIKVRTNKSILPIQTMQTIDLHDDVYEYLLENSSFYYNETDHTKLRDKIKDELGIKATFYKEKSKIDHGRVWGYTNFGIRLIVIQSNLGTTDYITTVAHEYTHLKYYALNELWTNFETFKFLYNSKDKDLHQAGINFALSYLNPYVKDSSNYGNYKQREYDISYYAYNYILDDLNKN